MNAARIVDDYCEAVLSGDIVTGQLQRAAVQRYRNDCSRAKEKSCPFYFDANRAAYAVGFIGLLCFTTDDWAGKPFKLEPWQTFIVWNVFGWIDKRSGYRRFHFVWLEIARKNGKTEFAAALEALLFFGDGVHGAECYSAATLRDQAAIVFDKVVFMWERLPFLHRLAKYLESKKRLLKPDGGIMRPLSAEGKTADGFNPSGVFCDELHEWKGKKHVSLWGKLNSGSGVRGNWLVMVITTAGDDESSLWKRERKYSARVVTGELTDDCHFSFICCLDDDDDPLDSDNWPKANPNLGVSCKLDYLRGLALKAAEVPEALNDFKRFHCNLMVESVNRAIPDDLWKRGAKSLPILSGRLCFGGIDIGFRDDLAAFGMAFPPQTPGEPWWIKIRAFAPEKSKRNWLAEPFATWIRSGLLTLTPGNTTDSSAILAAVEDCRSLYILKSVAIDPNNARLLGSDLVSRGVKTFEFQQWARNWNEPFREIIRLFSEGLIGHGDDPVLTWCVQWLMTHQAAGLIRPAKEHSKEKIDPLVAVLMALAEGLFYRTRNPTEGDGPRIRILNN